MSITLIKNPWLVKHVYSETIENSIFCFPYAGSSSQAFLRWKRALPENINVFAVQYPGRLGLVHQEPKKNIQDLVYSLYEHVLPYMVNKKFIFFGHSVGSLIAFELAKLLQRNKLSTPIHLIVSACLSPQKAGRELKIHNLPDDVFMEIIKGYGGTPKELFEDKGLMELFLPVLKADFCMYEEYQFNLTEKLTFPVTAFGSRQDPYAPFNEMQGWKDVTQMQFKHIEIQGGHFYINEDQGNFFEKLNPELENIFGTRTCNACLN